MVAVEAMMPDSCCSLAHAKIWHNLHSAGELRTKKKLAMDRRQQSNGDKQQIDVEQGSNERTP